MKTWLAVPALLFMLLLTLLALPGAHAAATLSDGSYTIDYSVKKAENDSVSMANDYFEKPAKVFVKNGEMTVQLQMNHSKWITLFKVPANGGFADAPVLSSDKAEDTRVVSFKVDDLSKPLLSKIHVTVESIDYDHDYTIRFVFDDKSIKNVGSSDSAAAAAADKATPAASAATGASKAVEPASKQQPTAAVKAPAAETKSASAAAASNADKSKPAVVNPQTGDKAPVTMLIILLAVSGMFLGYKFKARKSKV
ncbi:heme uptake protein IsdC [Paenibacillus radicis (ex Xue et al. 2023)]|uniref:Heme uptake protein IsdC n=1 Tax=Paenibacillus radicis (ex Xue et al. 2023) TaxID=2972489 RepID=A0ABT1YTI0_9BACL|nr:heme uptake protein IsdC [Paenibacillus radicis (ex Xue et al. 2023)]MCR8635639.1 heme uptake protein IsdC [Paenibacillus radicis (ex Xue et al. 2023)]